MDVEKIKQDFPILSRKVNGRPLVYLDNAATSQKPQVVIDALVDYYSKHNANVHRGIHTLGDESTRMYAVARQEVAGFVGAKPNELVFVRNTTEAINLVAYAWGRANLGEGDVVVLSELEHHSNITTWQEVARETGAGVVYVSVTGDGQIDVEELGLLLEKIGEGGKWYGDTVAKRHSGKAEQWQSGRVTKRQSGMVARVKLVALTAVSNTTGAELDVDGVVRLVREKAKGARILIDGAQLVPHKKVEFEKMGVDFLAFSGHKMYGPMGIGGLVVRKDVLEEMGPFLTGGGMIGEVGLTGSSWAELPDKYDAGTPNVAGAVGLAAACRYLTDKGMEKVEKHGRELVEYALERLERVQKVKVVGPTKEILRQSGSPHVARSAQDDKLDMKSLSSLSIERLGSVAFLYEGVHGHDVAQVLDSEGVAVRSGHHCTMPLHTKMGWSATTRVSFGIYNTKEDVDRLVEGLKRVDKVFGG